MRTIPRISRRKFLGTGAGAVLAVSAGRSGSVLPANVVVLDAQAPQGASPAGGPAGDLMLVNGRIHTMDARNSVVSAVTVRNGRFAAVGDAARPAAVPPNTQVIDLRGRTVVPGIVESHLHGLELGLRAGYHTPLLENTTSIREVQEVLAEHRKTVPEGQWVTAMGAWHPNQWAEHRYPTLKELDEAVPDRPVLLHERFTGPGVTNTLGKKFFDAADAVPPVHPDYKKVNVSETGAIGASTAMGGPSTSALFLLRRLQTFDDKIRNSLSSMAYANSLGHTAWLDKGTLYSLGPLHPNQSLAGLDPYRVVDPWNLLHREGRMSLRVQFDFTCFAETNPELPMLKEYLRNQLPFFGDDWLRTGGIGEWAAPLASGAPWRAAQRVVAQAGWRNDNTAGNMTALKQVVDEYEAVNREVDITGLRWSVNLTGRDVDVALLTRLKAMGCSVQTCANNWVTSTDPNVVAGPPFRTIAEHGIKTVLFSNAAHIAPLNPWLHLYYATTGVNSFGAQVNPDQHLTREEALRLFTREKGWFLRMEDRIGSIEPGKLADLAVLDRDYFSVPDVEIKKIRSVMTVVDGKIVHGTAP
jgi:predicted amidohydrolase YtcJ